MDAETFEGKALSYVLIRPEGAEEGAGYPLVVLLHGFGASMYDLAGLALAIDPSSYVYAFPNAPYRVDFGGGQTGRSWAAGRPGIEPPPADAPSVDELLDGFLAEVMEQTGARPGSIALGGFSQGGGLTLRYGLPRPETFAGLMVLSGFFRDADYVRPLLPASRAQPIFLAHGTADPMVGPEAGRLTNDFLIESGYAPEFREYDMAHEITPAEIDDLAAWLRRTLPPGS